MWGIINFFLEINFSIDVSNELLDHFSKNNIFKKEIKGGECSGEAQSKAMNTT